ncbi:unnamed protein product [Brachionus calyciflorus]|uniref:Uncharacterized protein n=1 Tax=Brachionus calyciflorus TaxID=104777 RepID=A0A814QUZ9_9BILA|nr:unnamed protein product [Brachionus calyciflorus]
MHSLDEVSDQLERSLNLNTGFISMSQKGAPQLHFNGQFYRINSKPNKDGKINWRFSLKDIHNHATSPTKLYNLERRRKIRTKAENSDERPRKIINELDDNYESISDEQIANIPSFEADRLFINRTKKNKPRTNNSVESWHNAFSSILNKHPMVYLLVNSLVNEKKRTETELVKLRTGIVHKRKSKYLLLDEIIQEIVKSYNPEK